MLERGDTHISVGYWQVFELPPIHADDDEDEDRNERRWREREEDDDREERNNTPAVAEPKPVVNTPVVEKKASPIVVKSVPKTENITIMSTLIEPYKPMNGLTYVIYHLPDNGYIVEDPDGKFLDEKYTSIESAKKAIDAFGIYEPLVAYTTPNGETFLILQNLVTKLYAYQKDEENIVQTAFKEKNQLQKDLLKENPYNPNNPHIPSLENTINSDEESYALAIAEAEGTILELITLTDTAAVSLERPVVPEDHQASVKALIDKKVVTVTRNTPQVTNTNPPKTVAPKQTATAPKAQAPVVSVAPKATPAPAPAPTPAPIKKPTVNTTTRAS